VRKISSSFIFISLFILLVGCSKELSDERITEMKNEGFSEGVGWSYDAPIIHKENVEDGVIAFYEQKGPTNALGAMFIEKTLFGWEATNDRVEGGLKNPRKSIRTLFAPKLEEGNNSPFPILFGLIEEDSIKEIQVEYQYKGNLKEVQGKTIHAEGRYLWFAFVDEPNTEITYIIKGYSNEGDLLETVEEVAIVLPEKDGI